jgi:hypothetical protein
MANEWRALRRIGRTMWLLAAAGAIGLTVWRGWTWGVGWLIGSALSALNFRWMKQMADGLGREGAKPRKAVFLGMRYLLLGGGLYVILKFTAISVPAALAGLFLLVAAVLLEILFELALYARNGTVGH